MKKKKIFDTTGNNTKNLTDNIFNIIFINLWDIKLLSIIEDSGESC